MSKPILLIVDAPGGPHPSFYLPSLLATFEVHVVWLDVEPQGPRQARVEALQTVTRAGGRVIAVPEPAAVPEELTKAVAQTVADGVIAFSERVVHMAQQVAWEAELPANPPGVLKRLQDKGLQREALAAGGLTTPRVWILRTSGDVERAMQTVSFPGVLKPAVGMGSIAVFRIEEPHQLLPMWQQARRLVDEDTRISHHSPALLLEEELVGDPAAAHDRLGDYLSVEALVIDGDPHVLAVSDKLPLSVPYRENGHLLPALRTDDECAEAIAVVEHAHRSLGITFGATHTEVKLTPTGPVVIEVNGRVGGSVPEQLSLAADYDLPLNLARLSVGQRPDVSVACHRWAAYLTPQPPEGRHIVDVAPTIAELRAIAGIESVYHVVDPGTVVDSADGTASNLLRVVAALDTSSQIFDLATQLGDSRSFKTRPAEPTRRNHA
jgi:biotin carboxylase